MRPSKSVLVLDDFPDSAEAVAAWLTMEGRKVIWTTSADEAMSIVATCALDAIVMEPYLRAGSAVDVAIVARRQASPPLLVAVTWSARLGNHVSYEPTLFDYNLFKPVSMPKLSGILGHIEAT